MNPLSRICIRLAIVALSVSMTPHMSAQGTPILTRHDALPTLHNPASAGTTDYLRLRGAGRLQWIGIDNAPKSFAAAADMPLSIAGHRAGTGMTFIQESLGLFSNLLASAQATYRLNLKQGFISFGIQGGYYSTRFKGSEIYIPDGDDYHNPDDPAVPLHDITGNTADFSLGISYVRPSFHLGIAAAHITSPAVSLDSEATGNTDRQQFETHLPRTLYFDAGGNIQLKNTLFLVQPALLAACNTDGFNAAASLRAVYNRFLSFGIGYRWKDAISVMVGAEFKNFFVGYAFDYPTSAISRASSGSHELVAGYNIRLDFSGKNRHRQRSIRIM